MEHRAYSSKAAISKDALTRERLTENDLNDSQVPDTEQAPNRPVRGRGATVNPTNRFEPLQIEPVTHGPSKLETSYLEDATVSIISRNQSPDIPFDISLNPYRGCEHGCSYCYARNSHEFLGFSPGLDFETKILVKHQAPELLRRELCSPRWQPQKLAMSGVTDAYQPIERKLQITRACLEVLAEMKHPVGIITKSPLVARDADLLARLARHHAASVSISITSLDPHLARAMEPRAGHPRRRLEAIRTLAKAGVPVGVMTAPIVPGLNDHEPAAILAAAAEAGASFAGYTILRLPGAVAGIFDAWLDEHFPQRKKKIMSRLRSVRDGKLSESRFGRRMTGQGPFYAQTKAMFHISLRRHGLSHRGPRLSAANFEPPGQQLGLFLPP